MYENRFLKALYWVSSDIKNSVTGGVVGMLLLGFNWSNMQIEKVRVVGFTLLTSALTNLDALSILLSYCSTVCQYVVRADVKRVTFSIAPALVLLLMRSTDIIPSWIGFPTIVPYPHLKDRVQLWSPRPSPTFLFQLFETCTHSASDYGFYNRVTCPCALLEGLDSRSPSSFSYSIYNFNR